MALLYIIDFIYAMHYSSKWVHCGASFVVIEKRVHWKIVWEERLPHFINEAEFNASVLSTSLAHEKCSASTILTVVIGIVFSYGRLWWFGLRIILNKHQYGISMCTIENQLILRHARNLPIEFSWKRTIMRVDFQMFCGLTLYTFRYEEVWTYKTVAYGQIKLSCIDGKMFS